MFISVCVYDWNKGKLRLMLRLCIAACQEWWCLYNPSQRCDVAVKSIPQTQYRWSSWNTHNFCIEIVREKFTEHLRQSMHPWSHHVQCARNSFCNGKQDPERKKREKIDDKERREINTKTQNWYQPRRRQRLKNHNWKSATHYAGQNITTKNGKVHTKLRQMRREYEQKGKKMPIAWTGTKNSYTHTAKHLSIKTILNWRMDTDKKKLSTYLLDSLGNQQVCACFCWLLNACIQRDFRKLLRKSANISFSLAEVHLHSFIVWLDVWNCCAMHQSIGIELLF